MASRGRRPSEKRKRDVYLIVLHFTKRNSGAVARGTYILCRTGFQRALEKDRYLTLQQRAMRGVECHGYIASGYHLTDPYFLRGKAAKAKFEQLHKRCNRHCPYART